jgi:hypothetical protein
MLVIPPRQEVVMIVRIRGLFRIVSWMAALTILLTVVLATGSASSSVAAKQAASPTPDGTPAATRVFRSKRSGFTLAYDPTVWKRVKATETDYVAGEKDRVTFTNGVSRVSLIGTTEYAEDEMAVCRDDYVAAFFAHPEVAQGPVVVIEKQEQDRASVGYLYFLGSEGMTAMKARYTECRWLGDGLAVVIIHTAPAMEFAGELDARMTLLEGLEPPVPTASPTATS